MFFFTFIKKTLLETCIKNIKLQMFPIATFRHHTRKEYLTQIIKNKNLPFVKIKNLNVLAWCSGNAFDPINEVTVRPARLVLR